MRARQQMEPEPVRAPAQSAAAQAVELLAQQLDLLRLHAHEGLQLALHVNLLEALVRVARRVLVLGLDLVDHLALEHRALELLDLLPEVFHLVLLVGREPVDGDHLPLELGGALLVRALELVDLALELHDLLLLLLVRAALHLALQVLGHAQQLQVAHALGQVVGLHVGARVLPLQQRDAPPEVAHLLEDDHLLATELLDVGVEALDRVAMDEGRLRVVRDHRRLLHLELPLLELERQLEVPHLAQLGVAPRLQLLRQRVALVARLVVRHAQLVEEEGHLAELLRRGLEVGLRLDLGAARLDQSVPHVEVEPFGHVGRGVERVDDLRHLGRVERRERIARRAGLALGLVGRAAIARRRRPRGEQRAARAEALGGLGRWLGLWVGAGRRGGGLDHARGLAPLVQPDEAVEELGHVGEVAAEGALERAVLGGEGLVRLAHELHLALEVAQPRGGAELPLLALLERGLELGLLLLEELLAQPRLRQLDGEQLVLVDRLLVARLGVAQPGEPLVEAPADVDDLLVELGQLGLQPLGALLALRLVLLDALLELLDLRLFVLAHLRRGDRVHPLGPHDLEHHLLLLHRRLERAVHHRLETAHAHVVLVRPFALRRLCREPRLLLSLGGRHVRLCMHLAVGHVQHLLGLLLAVHPDGVMRLVELLRPHAQLLELDRHLRHAQLLLRDPLNLGTLEGEHRLELRVERGLDHADLLFVQHGLRGLAPLRVQLEEAVEEPRVDHGRLAARALGLLLGLLGGLLVLLALLLLLLRVLGLDRRRHHLRRRIPDGRSEARRRLEARRRARWPRPPVELKPRHELLGAAQRAHLAQQRRLLRRRLGQREVGELRAPRPARDLGARARERVQRGGLGGHRLPELEAVAVSEQLLAQVVLARLRAQRRHARVAVLAPRRLLLLVDDELLRIELLRVALLHVGVGREEPEQPLAKLLPLLLQRLRRRALHAARRAARTARAARATCRRRL
eukprot:scaffold85781_cov61-Phaeocystis_antarctica.AAC.4